MHAHRIGLAEGLQCGTNTNGEPYMHDSTPVPVARAPLARTSDRVTLTNEAELERARLECLRTPDDSAPAQTNLPPLVCEMQQRLAQDDFAGALATAEAILGSGGDVDPEVQACADSCRAKLMESYVESVGSLDQVPVMVAAFDEIEARSVDHRAGFLLSQVDGVTSLETILDVSGMPPLDALRIVRELLRRGIVVLRAVPGLQSHRGGH
jgi:hypothetical protein